MCITTAKDKIDVRRSEGGALSQTKHVVVLDGILKRLKGLGRTISFQGVRGGRRMIWEEILIQD